MLNDALRRLEVIRVDGRRAKQGVHDWRDSAVVSTAVVEASRVADKFYADVAQRDDIDEFAKLSLQKRVYDLYKLISEEMYEYGSHEAGKQPVPFSQRKLPSDRRMGASRMRMKQLDEDALA